MQFLIKTHGCEKRNTGFFSPFDVKNKTNWVKPSLAESMRLLLEPPALVAGRCWLNGIIIT